MKTRDEQAEEYSARWEEATEECNHGWSEPIYRCNAQGIEDAFLAGWDAALKSQWRDASEELPMDSQDVFFRYVDECDSPSFAKGRFWKGTNVDSIFIYYGRVIKLDHVTHWMPIPDLP